MQAFPWRARVGTINGCAPSFVYPDGAFASPGSQLNGPPDINDTDVVTAPTPTTVHEDTWLVRIDYKINEKQPYGRAQRDISLVDAPNGSSPSRR